MTQLLRSVLPVFLIAVVAAGAVPNRTSAQQSGAPSSLMSSAGDTIRMNLRQCLDRAMRANLDIRESELELSRSQVDEFEASMARWLPIFEVRAFTSLVKGVEGTHMEPNLETSWSNIGPYFQVTGEAAQPITTFGRISSLRSAARHGVRAGQANVAVRRAEVAGEVYRYYHGILLARELLDILEDASDKLNGVRNRVRKMLDEGSDKVTTFDLARIDVYAFELEKMRIEAEKSIRLALGALQRALAIPYNVQFEIDDGRLRPIPDTVPDLDSLRVIALRQRPEITQVEAGVKARHFQLEAEKARRYPEVFIGMDWNLRESPTRTMTSSNPFANDSYNSRSVRAALGARWQLGLSDRESDIRRAQVNYQEMIRKRSWAKQSIELEVQKAYEDTRQAQEISQLGRRSLRAGRAGMVQMYERYDMGVASVRELLEAYATYLKSQADYYQALHNHHIALSELYRTVGWPVWNIDQSEN